MNLEILNFPYLLSQAIKPKSIGNALGWQEDEDRILMHCYERITDTTFLGVSLAWNVTYPLRE